MSTHFQKEGFHLLFQIFFHHKSPQSDLDFNTIETFPVLHNGRIKPLDSVARHSLIVISGKQSVTLDGKKVHATPWLFDVLSNAKHADTHAVFFIHNPDLKTLLGIKNEKQKFASFSELIPYKKQLK